jgi:hypothetical protein
MILHRMFPSARSSLKLTEFCVLRSRDRLTLDIVLLSINVIQWGALWIKGNIGRDVVYLASNDTNQVCDLLHNCALLRLS